MLARYVELGATVLALPFGIDGNSMFWQTEVNFRFRLAGGYVSWAVPSEYRDQTIIRELTGRAPGGHLTRRLRAFIALTHTNVILLRDHTTGYWHQLLDPLKVKPCHADGFAIYELTASLQQRHDAGRRCDR